ncbi:uncharacterized protein LACBIDRAFT_306929 [Laccaria bicolor S238N-H82]|uniref:Predicted protein n=1 Tax=Laccaria bicolor (strain S238N-H82 / ATCC MYA-4686) TaxID=486041 RepID=B0DP06_LACBS|nr:uncharacterized protein LACBIDRAFT_306929 [Laccaria bicolor S238N-H82]EDR03739.1 predicted protein [Laccaria bicolor S238N-H82]|eukprot:XP_001885592.1 predicted protein [Laccaria bicolor S238N-H82]
MAGSKGKEAFRRPLHQLKTPLGKDSAPLSLFPSSLAHHPWQHRLPLELRSPIMASTPISDSVPKFGRCWVRRSHRCRFHLLCWLFLSDHVYPAQ